MIEGDERGKKSCLLYISDFGNSLNQLAGYYAFLGMACHRSLIDLDLGGEEPQSVPTSYFCGHQQTTAASEPWFLHL